MTRPALAHYDGVTGIAIVLLMLLLLIRLIDCLFQNPSLHDDETAPLLTAHGCSSPLSSFSFIFISFIFLLNPICFVDNMSINY